MAAVAAHLRPPVSLTANNSSGGVAATRILDACGIPWINTDHLKNVDGLGIVDATAEAGAGTSTPAKRNYWWVSQGNNYSTVIEQGSLWAPDLRADRQPGHEDWQALHRMQPGDVVFHYASQQFRALSMVAVPGVEADRPPGYLPDDGYPHGTGTAPAFVDSEF